MNWISHQIVQRTGISRLGIALCILVTASTAMLVARSYWREIQASRLQITAERLNNEVMSLTMSGSLMGAIMLLGLTNDEIKADGMSRGDPNTPPINLLFQAVCRTFNTEGVYIVNSEGLVRASWNNGAKPATGINVRFRPYFPVAMRGLESIYAAISLGRGDRALYFTAPIYADPSKLSGPVGIIGARTTLDRVDAALKKSSDIALLVSPHGVIFAGSRPAWIGQLIEEPTEERIKALRELKQFGKLFEKGTPRWIAISTQSRITRFEEKSFAVASSPIRWNDPSGEWKLILMEDLAQTIPATRLTLVALIASVAAYAVILLLLHSVRSRHHQKMANFQIRDLARTQEIQAEQKARIASLSLRLQQAPSREALGQIFFSEAHALLGVQQGVLYTVSENDEKGLTRIASYACIAPLPDRIGFGEGLLGQCAQERRPITFKTPAETCWRIHSGLGEALPGCVSLNPVELNQNLVGVIEIALPTLPDAHQRACLDAMLPVLAMNLEVSRRIRFGDGQNRESATTAGASEHFEHAAETREGAPVQTLKRLGHESEALALTSDPGTVQARPST